MLASNWLIGLCCFCLGCVVHTDLGYPHPKSLFHLARITICDILFICLICRPHNYLKDKHIQGVQETFGKAKETFGKAKETFGKAKETFGKEKGNFW